MKLPKLEKPDKYVGLYVVDFSDGSTKLTAGHTGVGFTLKSTMIFNVVRAGGLG
jgi:hypothetical protein